MNLLNYTCQCGSKACDIYSDRGLIHFKCRVCDSDFILGSSGRIGKNTCSKCGITITLEEEVEDGLCLQCNPSEEI